MDQLPQSSYSEFPTWIDCIPKLWAPNLSLVKLVLSHDLLQQGCKYLIHSAFNTLSIPDQTWIWKAQVACVILHFCTVPKCWWCCCCVDNTVSCKASDRLKLLGQRMVLGLRTNKSCSLDEEMSNVRVIPDPKDNQNNYLHLRMFGTLPTIRHRAVAVSASGFLSTASRACPSNLTQQK